MSKSDGHRHGRAAGCAVKRIVRGLAERLGVDRGLVIAGFVVGFVFAPALALLAVVLAWIWVGNPERFERAAGRLADALRRGYQAAFRPGASGAQPVTEPPVAEPLDFPELRREFEDLERRAAGMEAFVTSDEARLHREFRRLRDE